MSSKNKWQKVFDTHNRRVRGLWFRNRVFYAQLRLDGESKATRIPLHEAKTVP
jgi:hypothetical protein